VSLPAGARRVPLATFVALTIVGCALWAAAFVLAGMLAGSAWSSISSVLGRVLLGVGVLVLVLSVSRRSSHRSL
jgi:membrane protein DedA with SNARE-associated domain